MSSQFPTIPGYRIERLLGTGGMAAVWLAVQENLGRPVALKVMANTLGLDERFRARFLNEARLVAQLRHPNILSIHDSGSAPDGQLYMVTEYLDGGTLKDRIGEGLAPAQSLRIVLALAGALAAAHERRIWHRDIKPDNVLFDRKGHFVLADFGIAKADGEQAANLTGTGNIVGTPRYMSPEQFQGQPVDARSDIYSLGVMLFEMLTGEAPYADGDTYALALKHIQAPVPELPSALSRLQPLMARMLAKSPAERFPDCAALAAALQDALREDGAPSLAPLPPPREPAPPPRRGVLPAAVGLLAVAGIGAWLLFGRGAPETTVETAVPPAPGARGELANAGAAADGDAASRGRVADAAATRADATPAAADRTQTPANGVADGLAAQDPDASPRTADPAGDTASTGASTPAGDAAAARIPAPRARIAVDAAALVALDDRALESRLGPLLRGGDLARWESSLAALPAGGPGAHARGRHLALFERLQAAGLSLDGAAAPSLAAGSPAARVIAALLDEAPRLDRGGAKGRPSPPARNAVDAYRMVLALDPANEAARSGLDALIADFRTAARAARDRGNEAAAQRLDQRARAVDPEAFAAND
jgi:hypothetical protein